MEDVKTPTQVKIGEVLGWMDELLVHKNRNYGDSALKPLGDRKSVV